MNEQNLRKRIDDQLNKLESTHLFARAVFYGQNGQLRYAGKEEQKEVQVPANGFCKT